MSKTDKLNPKKIISVQMKLSQETVNLVEELKYWIHTTNKTNVIVSAIKTLHFLMKEEHKGSKVIIRNEAENIERELKLIN